jgi:large subunit ribosomal protein L22
MLSRCVAKYIRMSPRKAREIMSPLRKQTVAQALEWLNVSDRRAAGPISKAIGSAFANAKQQDPTLVEDQVIISRLICDMGPVWKRFRAAAFGRAVPIRKPTAHIIVELDRKEGRRTPQAPKTPPKASRGSKVVPMKKVLATAKA